MTNKINEKVKKKMTIEKYLKQVVNHGYIICPKCYNNMDSDQDKCICGKFKNPLRENGLI